MQTATVQAALLGCHGSFVGKRRKKVWRVTPLCIFWTIWKERNHRVFDNEERLDLYLKNSFLSNLFTWVKMYIEIDFMSLFDFVE